MTIPTLLETGGEGEDRDLFHTGGGAGPGRCSCRLLQGLPQTNECWGLHLGKQDLRGDVARPRTCSQHMLQAFQTPELKPVAPLSFTRGRREKAGMLRAACVILRPSPPAVWRRPAEGAAPLALAARGPKPC